jgi:dolichyl-phosphate-mannose--protein O-mannosyl transferase
MWLFALGLALRLPWLNSPDLTSTELSLLESAGQYSKGLFFIDVNPPLGKLIIALALIFQKALNFPLVYLRLLSCLSGALLVPVVLVNVDRLPNNAEFQGFTRMQFNSSSDDLL